MFLEWFFISSILALLLVVFITNIISNNIDKKQDKPILSIPALCLSVTLFVSLSMATLIESTKMRNEIEYYETIVQPNQYFEYNHKKEIEKDDK